MSAPATPFWVNVYQGEEPFLGSLACATRLEAEQTTIHGSRSPGADIRLICRLRVTLKPT